MKYMLMFNGTPEGQEEWDSMPEDVRNEGYAKVGQWFGSHADKVVSTYELQGPAAGARVTIKDGKATVTDGPYAEAKEIIGGYAIIEVAGRDEAVEMACSWPGGGVVEVRPVVER